MERCFTRRIARSSRSLGANRRLSPLAQGRAEPEPTQQRRPQLPRPRPLVPKAATSRPSRAVAAAAAAGAGADAAGFLPSPRASDRDPGPAGGTAAVRPPRHAAKAAAAAGTAPSRTRSALLSRLELQPKTNFP